MRIAFVNTPFFNRFSRESRSPAVTKSDTLYYPKWLALATGYAKKCGNKVTLIDAPANSYSFDQTYSRIKEFNADLVVLDTSTPSINNDISFAEFIKSKSSASLIAMVGRGISVSYEYVLRRTNSVDFACLREYELTVAELADCIGQGSLNYLDNVSGIAFKNLSGDIVKNVDRIPLENLDLLPFVTESYLEFLNPKDYFYGHSLYPLVVFDTSRGCPYHCNFCAYPQTFSGHRVRYRSVTNVADEFDFVAKEMPEIRSIMLEDDTFIVNKKRTLELANQLILRENKIMFDSNCRVDIGVEKEFLATLKKAGARLFCVGFESGSNDVISHMDKNNKKTNDTTYKSTAFEFAKLCNQVGIKIHGCFMFGNLNETIETMNETLDFALSLPLDTAQFYPIMIYPGTKAFEEALELGYVNATSFDDWLTHDGHHRSVVDLPKVSQGELLKFADLARKKFYLRPGYICKKIGQSLSSLDEFKRNLKGFSKLVTNLVHGSSPVKYSEIVERGKQHGNSSEFVLQFKKIEK